MRDSDGKGRERIGAASLVRIAVFAALLGVILYVLSVTVFDGASWFKRGWIINRNARVAAIEAEPENTIDVLALGNSLGVSAICPPEMWDRYGMTVFNCGQDGANPVETCAVAERILTMQKPKICLIETDMLYQGNKDMMLRQVALKMPFQNAFPMIRYHNVWMTAVQVHPFRTYFKGYLVNGVTDAYTGGAYYEPTQEREEIKPIYLYYLRKMIRVLRSRGVVPVLYSAPSPGNYSMERHNRISDLAAEEDVLYYDMNEDPEAIGINWQEDTRDGGMHLNVRGAAKVSLDLADLLTSRYALEDHRGQAGYEDWENMIPIYRQTADEMSGTCYTELEEPFGIINW